MDTLSKTGAVSIATRKRRISIFKEEKPTKRIGKLNIKFPQQENLQGKATKNQAVKKSNKVDDYENELDFKGSSLIEDVVKVAPTI
jgi:hypothetical protein